MRPLSRLALAGTRHAIDHLDDAMLRLFAGRQRLASTAGKIKRRAGQDQYDPAREHNVHHRARTLAARIGLPADSAQRLMQWLIAEAHRQQRAQAPARPLTSLPMVIPRMQTSTAQPSPWLGLLPPPARWRPVLARVPLSWQQRLVLHALSKALASPQAIRILQPIDGRRIGIHIHDLGLRWALEMRDDRLQLATTAAEVTVSGSMTDLLLLASRLEDADTLFFQRKLTLTGDTELGLLLRNLLDRLPWEELPLGSRIVLQRAGKLAGDARAAHHARSGRAG